MNSSCSRRQFLKRTFAAGALALAPAGTLLGQTAAKRTAVDEVTLGQTGIKLSRLGMGTGSSGGHVQTALGRDGFTKLVHYAYDQGIRYFDCAEAYATFPWIANAIKGLPREKLFLQSKIGRQPADVLAAIDGHRKTFNSDYVDSMLVHCMVQHNWTEEWKRVMEGFDQARRKSGFGPKASPATVCPPCAPPSPRIGRRSTWCGSTLRAAAWTAWRKQVGTTTIRAMISHPCWPN